MVAIFVEARAGVLLGLSIGVHTKLAAIIFVPLLLAAIEALGKRQRTTLSSAPSQRSSSSPSADG